LTNDLYDKDSLQPDYNQCAVKIEKTWLILKLH
jgi:hypothetical protein